MWIKAISGTLIDPTTKNQFAVLWETNGMTFSILLLNSYFLGQNDQILTFLGKQKSWTRSGQSKSSFSKKWDSKPKFSFFVEMSNPRCRTILPFTYSSIEALSAQHTLHYPNIEDMLDVTRKVFKDKGDEDKRVS
jgi:hypothetical protein